MNKTGFILFLASLPCLLASCSNLSQDEQSRLDTVDKSYTLTENFDDLDFKASELSYWLSYNKGKAELEDSKIKISTTSEYYGGIRSLYKTKLDFSKQVYLNFKGFETAESNVAMMIKMVFHDYSSSDSAYILSNDFIGLNGDFSLNIENALLRYGSSASNMELFENGEPRFKGKEVYVSFYICAFNNSESGLSNDEAWIKFSSFDVSYQDEKAGGELGCFAISHDGINAKNRASSNKMTRSKNATPFQIKPQLNGSEMEAKDLIFASSSPDKVVVSSSGLLSFEGVTKETARVVAYPRADIALGGVFQYPKARMNLNSGFYVDVLGLWQGNDIYNNVLNLFSSSDSIAADENLSDLFEGNLLSKQKISATNFLNAITLVVSSNALNVLNNYSGSEEDKKEADDNGSSYSLSLAINNDDYVSASSGKVTVINCADDKATIVSKEHSFATGESFAIKIKYLNEDYSKYSDAGKYLVLWDNGSSKRYAYFTTSVIDTKELIELSPGEIAKSISTDRSWDGLKTEVVSEGGSEVFRMGLTLRDLTAYYAFPFIELYADTASADKNQHIKLDFKKNLKAIINFGECSNVSYNIRFNRIASQYVNEYWRDDGMNYTDLTIGDEFMFIDLYHYANKGNVPGMINLAIAKSLPVEFGFDISLRERDTIGNEGHLDIKSIYFLYE